MIQRPFFSIEFCATMIRSPVCWGMITVVLIGCGRSEPNESLIVEPPTPSITETAPDRDSGKTLPSGGIELPAGEIPLPESGETPGGTRGIEMPDTDTSAVNTGASATNPEILYASWNEIQSEAEASGKVTVVDLWSLSCEPCLKEFPGLVHLHQEMGASVQCIAVDMDYDGRKSRPPEHYADRVTKFLASVGASGFATYISSTPSDDVFTAMKIPSLPAVLVYGADGKVAKVFVDAGETAGFTYEKDIIPLVAKLAG